MTNQTDFILGTGRRFDSEGMLFCNDATKRFFDADGGFARPDGEPITVLVEVRAVTGVVTVFHEMAVPDDETGVFALRKVSVYKSADNQFAGGAIMTFTITISEYLTIETTGTYVYRMKWLNQPDEDGGEELAAFVSEQEPETMEVTLQRMLHRELARRGLAPADPESDEEDFSLDGDDDEFGPGYAEEQMPPPAAPPVKGAARPKAAQPPVVSDLDEPPLPLGEPEE